MLFALFEMEVIIINDHSHHETSHASLRCLNRAFLGSFWECFFFPALAS